MSPHEHSILMAEYWDTNPDIYDDVNQFIDSSKLYFPFYLHRIFTHNTFFIGICERVFGMYVETEDNRQIPVRRVCEEHFKQDFSGVIPTIQDWVKELKIKTPDRESWIRNPNKKDLEFLKTYYEKK